MINKPAILALADGTVYEGIAIGADGFTVGELVFNTSMTGYQEMLTDPSYAGQIISLTTAHIGNTGCNNEDYESNKIWAAGLAIREYSPIASSYRKEQTLDQWLKKNGVVAIAGIDTRALTLKLRNEGVVSACISTEVRDVSKIIAKAKNFLGLNGRDLASEVMCKTAESWYEGCGNWGRGLNVPRFNVVVYDFGVKYNILRILHDLGCQLTVVPGDTSVESVLMMQADGVFLSNGPGDPAACTKAILTVQEFLQRDIPLFGICLGFQLLALACNGATKKMKFGHHGSNHPVIEVDGKKRIFITSQNHSFMVDENKLPSCLQITHRSLFDNSLQGFRHISKKALGFQGHPEASPGPHDIACLFDEFIQLMS